MEEKPISKDKKVLICSLIALMFACVLNGTNTSMQVVLADYAAKFNTINLTTIYSLVTLPQMFTLVFSLILGPLVGRKLKYKTTIAAGLMICFVSGFIPYFYMENFWFVLVCRVINGIGDSFVTFYNAAFLFGYGPEKGSKYIAFASTMGSLITIVLQNLTGVLVKISLNSMFLLETYGLVAFVIFVILFKEPQSSESLPQTDTQTSIDKSKFKFPTLFFLYIAVYYVAFLVVYTLPLTASTIISTKELGSASFTAIALSFFTAGGAVGGPLYSAIKALFKRYTVALILSLVAIGFTLIAFTSSVITYCIAFFLVGFSMIYMGFLMYYYLGSIIAKENMAIMTSVVTATAFLSMSSCNYWIGFVGKIFGGGEMIMTPVCAGMIIYIILTIMFVIIDPRPKEVR